MKNHYDIVVIGRGVAGHGVVHYLVDQFSSQIPKVAWVGTRKRGCDALDCSHHSSAMVARQGIKEGLSPLGNLLVASFHQCEHFIGKEAPAGVEEAYRYHLSMDEEGEEKIKRRFSQDPQHHKPFFGQVIAHREKAYLFEPRLFLRWWSDHLSPFVTEYDELALDLARSPEGGHWQVHLQRGVISANKVVLATGAMRRFLPLSSECLFKEVPGQYLLWRGVHFDEPFVITIGGHNLIYRHRSRELLLAGTSEESDVLLRNSQVLELRDLFLRHVPQLMPDRDPEIVAGLRQKGRKREPVCGAIDHNLYLIDSLYKNGYSFCHGLGKKLAQELGSN